MFDIAPVPDKKTVKLSVEIRGAIRFTTHVFSHAERCHDEVDGGSGWAFIYKCSESGLTRRYGFVGTRGAV